jgi:hypothetical protein
MEQERKRPAARRYIDKYTSGNTPPLIAIGKLCASKEQDNKIDEGETFSLTRPLEDARNTAPARNWSNCVRAGD